MSASLFNGPLNHTSRHPASRFSLTNSNTLLDHRRSLNPGYVLYGLLNGSSDTHQEKLRSTGIQWFPTGVSRHTGVPREISGFFAKNFKKNNLGRSNFAVFVRKIRRERGSVNSSEKFFQTSPLFWNKS